MELASSIIGMSGLAGNDALDTASPDTQAFSASDTSTPELEGQGKEFLELFNSNGVDKVSPEEKLAQMAHSSSISNEKKLDIMAAPATDPEVILQQQQQMVEFQIEANLLAKTVNGFASCIKQLETMQ